MDETDKRIREPTEDVRTEKDIRIRDRMIIVRGVLGKHATNVATDLQTWTGAPYGCGWRGSTRTASTASGTLPAGAGSPG